MLVIGRKRDEKLIINGNIEITVLKVGRNHVKFGVTAPREVPIQTRSAGEDDRNPARGERTQVAGVRQSDAKVEGAEPDASLSSAASASDPSSGPERTPTLGNAD